MHASAASSGQRPVYVLGAQTPAIVEALARSLERRVIAISALDEIEEAEALHPPVILVDAVEQTTRLRELLSGPAHGSVDPVFVVLRRKGELDVAGPEPSAAIVATVEAPWDDEALCQAVRHAERVGSRRSQRVLRAPRPGPRVLILEDNADHAELIALRLKRADPHYRVSFARDLETALTLLHSEALDVVLADLWLPDAQGLDVVSILRDQVAEVPIVVLSELEDEALALEALQLGAQDYLQKASCDAGALDRAIRYAYERERNVERLARKARCDSLTKLLNRESFRSQVRQAIARARRRGRALGVLFFDLDGFKQVNDRLGHAAGDRLLREVARRLTAAVREHDTVARLGGDEFAVLLEELEGQPAAEDVARRALARLQDPIVFGDGSVALTASVGLAMYPRAGTSAGDLIGAADDAMYAAKRGVTPRLAVHEPQRAVDGSRGLDEHLRAAVRNRALQVHFQPQVDLRTRSVTGAEALLRCPVPGRRLLLGRDLLPFLTRSHLIVDVGAYVLERACYRAAQSAGSIAVNVALAELEAEGFVTRVATILEATELPSHRLELELRSPGELLRSPQLLAVLEQLRGLGVRIALDDIGADDSLRALYRLPIDTIKLDVALVSELPDHAGACLSAKALIDLAHAIGLRVVAEGVENEAQAAFLLENGCDAAQGFLYGEAAEALLAQTA